LEDRKDRFRTPRTPPTRRRFGDCFLFDLNHKSMCHFGLWQKQKIVSLAIGASNNRELQDLEIPVAEIKNLDRFAGSRYSMVESLSRPFVSIEGLAGRGAEQIADPDRKNNSAAGRNPRLGDRLYHIEPEFHFFITRDSGF